MRRKCIGSRWGQRRIALKETWHLVRACSRVPCHGLPWFKTLCRPGKKPDQHEQIEHCCNNNNWHQVKDYSCDISRTYISLPKLRQRTHKQTGTHAPHFAIALRVRALALTVEDSNQTSCYTCTLNLSEQKWPSNHMRLSDIKISSSCPNKERDIRKKKKKESRFYFY